jgi:hypothetical protein
VTYGYLTSIFTYSNGNVNVTIPGDKNPVYVFDLSSDTTFVESDVTTKIFLQDGKIYHDYYNTGMYIMLNGTLHPLSLLTYVQLGLGDVAVLTSEVPRFLDSVATGSEIPPPTEFDPFFLFMVVF